MEAYTIEGAEMTDAIDFVATVNDAANGSGNLVPGSN